ncbi:maltotransferase domain-containing protein [Burkholderia mayonis]|nr:maltotransferase domain-containing protein [Burkholderia mayonis]
MNGIGGVRLRIYFADARLVGPAPEWPALFAHAAALGFDHVLIGGLWRPGRERHVLLVADHGAAHPAFEDARHVLDVVGDLARRAAEYGITLLADLALDRVAADGELPRAHPDWFMARDAEDPRLDPRGDPYMAAAAHVDWQTPDVREALVDWWSNMIGGWASAGVGGFCVDAPQRVPASVWRALRERIDACGAALRWVAATPGHARAALASLEGAGFDAVFSSVRWWDARASWLADEHAALRRVGAPLGMADVRYGQRLAADFAHVDADMLERVYRRAASVAAAVGAGWLVPMGFEWGIASRLSYVDADRDRFTSERRAARFDLSDFLTTANGWQRDVAVLGRAGEVRQLTGADARATALLRGDAPDLRASDAAVLVVVNPDLRASVRVNARRFLGGVPGGFTRFAAMGAERRKRAAALESFVLEPAGCRLFEAATERAVRRAPVGDKPASRANGRVTVRSALAAPRIAIEDVTPSVDGGRFAVKRVIGDCVEVGAAIFSDGHERLAAAVVWRAADETAWRETPMRADTAHGDDRWNATIPLDRLGRHEFTIVAWRDELASLVDHVDKKLAAGQDVSVELDEAARLFADVLACVEAEAPPPEAALAAMRGLVAHYARADASARLAALHARSTIDAVAAARHRPFAARDPMTYRIDVDRAAARFASWYEMFPRSSSDDPARHGTFDDVIAQLPRIRDMGFDVLYFPPIHPIGVTHRKGRNNALRAEPGDVGSPYAIGAKEGGHTGVHPQLGTLDDFRRLVAAAREYGIEIALDFAIQCSPDHPWLAEHPGWFSWRPDGTLRYAENPPKRYQDIVTPDFYARDAQPGLWLALRDVVLFWIDAGVRTFRVDNPHTKPLPFWEWLIDDVRARFPDAVFLSEAFTRPRMMRRLAKLGFTQSYTYFTWRETKRELTDYLDELNAAPVRDYFRPNFFVNTPDINPRYLQTSGRAGFVIRAALAATLSGLWGVYSGFELCESEALPDSEEYLDAEKYQLRARNWARAGNIAGEIALLNRIRRANPALHTHLGVTFLAANNDRILAFEKATPARDNVLVVAISLDPHGAQEADIELSRATFAHWRLRDDDALSAFDEATGARADWRGRWRRVRVDPQGLPFAVWRIAPAAGLPPETADERCAAGTGPTAGDRGEEDSI